MAEIYISIGSNYLAESSLYFAYQTIGSKLTHFKSSSVYQTKAQGITGADFLNAVFYGQINLSIQDTFDWLHEIEQIAGRKKDIASKSIQILDLDLLLYDNIIIDTPKLLPRPEILQYAYVLYPLAEIAGDKIHPILNQDYTRLWQNFPDKSGITAITFDWQAHNAE